MIRLALHGPMYSGKTSVAHALVSEHGFTLVNYTDYLKSLAARALSGIQISTTVAEIKANKAEYRVLLQWLGTKVGFDDGAYVGQCLWEQGADEWGFDLEDRIVFDNVRTEAQFNLLIDYGFQLVRFEVSPLVQAERAQNLGCSVAELRAVSTHGIEQPIPYREGEVRLNGDSSVEELVAEIMGRPQWSAA
jgi:hypothetical protein